ncbi:MAG: FAD-dependent monooxygenase, partial [Victivallaceae bacterium]|nr:FAD-dependent monooxygenase [Victivallaceae bacterium]
MIVKINNLTLRAYSISPQEKFIDRQLTPFIARHLEINEDRILGYKILSKAVDSRRGVPALVYSLTVTLHNHVDIRPGAGLEVPAENAEKLMNAGLELPDAPAGLKNPLIIGSGPAGLMAALVLAQSGCEPVIVEGGCDVDRRRQDLDKFHRERIFNPESNYLLGEGGAGTFSDGKLYTGTKDPRSGFIMKTFVEAGA